MNAQLKADLRRYLAVIAAIFVIEFLSALVIQRQSLPFESLGTTLGLMCMGFLCSAFVRKESRFAVFIWAVIIIRALAYLGEYGSKQ